jgi:hypothetical protein
MFLCAARHPFSLSNTHSHRVSVAGVSVAPMFEVAMHPLTAALDTSIADVGRALRRMLRLIADADRLEIWRDSGARDTAHWIAIRYGISPRPITFGGGVTGAEPIFTTWRSSARSTTGWCTSTGGRSDARRPAIFCGAVPTERAMNPARLQATNRPRRRVRRSTSCRQSETAIERARFNAGARRATTAGSPSRRIGRSRGGVHAHRLRTRGAPDRPPPTRAVRHGARLGSAGTR